MFAVWEYEEDIRKLIWTSFYSEPQALGHTFPLNH